MYDGGPLIIVLYMNARPPISRDCKVSKGPAWGLKEQLRRRGKDANGMCATTIGQNQEDPTSGHPKIRHSVTGPALAHKIEQVNLPDVQD